MRGIAETAAKVYVARTVPAGARRPGPPPFAAGAPARHPLPASAPRPRRRGRPDFLS